MSAMHTPYGGLSAPRITPGLYPLKIELVPERLWGVNLRAMMTAHAWGKVRRAVYEKAGGVCEICGGAGARGRLECPETWIYDEGARLQTLTGLVALCPPCHRVKHLGFSDKMGKLEECIEHMARVNGMTKRQAQAYVEHCYAIQRRRARMKWTTNLDWFEAAYPGCLKSGDEP